MKKELLVIIAMLLACTTNEPQPSFSHNYKVSHCGGFSSLAKEAISGYQRDSADYCSAEKVRWHYDNATHTLRLLHTRNLQNCAAELEVEIRHFDGGFEVIEQNISTLSARCLCYFDTWCEIGNIEEKSVSIIIEGQSFTLDLDSQQGTLILDTTCTWPCL